MKGLLLFSTLLTGSAVTLILFLSSSAQRQSLHEMHGVAAEDMDLSIKPGDNFYLYANGNWIDHSTIPPDRSSINVFSRLADLSNQRSHDLIEHIVKSNPPAGSSLRKVADLYDSFMDDTAIEAKGLAPLKPHLDAIAAIHDKRELAYALGQSLRADVDALNNTNFHTQNLFGLWVAPGFHDPDHYTAYLLQGGLALPGREYYLADSEHMKALRGKYQAHVATMMKLAGSSDSEIRATRILELEHAIAQTHRSLAGNEEIHRADNTWHPAEFATNAPGLDWDEYFRGAGLGEISDFIVWQPDAFKGESALVASPPLESWTDWLAFHLIEAYASVLPKPLAEERFAFFERQLSGAQEERPRWQRGVVIVNAQLGDVVGKVYAQKYFSPQAKAQAQDMVARLIANFRKRIEALTWMNPSTKAEAEAKLSTLYVGVGYPETWQDYSNYEVKPGDIFGNIWRGSLSHYQREVGRLGKSVNRKEWSMTPQTVNAVNLPLQNALNFPAAVLQPPFYDPQAPTAVNYGAIGSIMGHEISHTFDTEGSTFDAKGGLRNWWTPEDLKHFEAATSALAAQYSSYQPFPDLAVNGRQTLGEDIADLAGIAAAYDGYHSTLAGKPAPVQGGFTGDQQFFIAFGQIWGTKIREQALRQRVLTDPHAPAQYRAETVRNVDAWYRAFDVKPGETLYLPPNERIAIW